MSASLMPQLMQTSVGQNDLNHVLTVCRLAEMFEGEAGL